MDKERFQEHLRRPSRRKKLSVLNGEGLLKNLGATCKLNPSGSNPPGLSSGEEVQGQVMLVIKRMTKRREAPACQPVGLKKASFIRVKHKSVDMTTNTGNIVKLLDARIPDVTHENHLVIIDAEDT